MKDYFSGFSIIVVTAVLAIVAFLIIGLVGVFGYGWFIDTTANRSGQTSAEKQIKGNGAFRIAAYNHFYDLCAAVQTDEQSIKNLQVELAATTDPTRRAVLPASITALRNNRADDINQYNADARKSYTVGQFKSSDLPYTLDIQGDTTCHA